MIADLTAEFGDRLHRREDCPDLPTLEIPPELITPVCTRLQQREETPCEQLTDLTAVDHSPRRPRFVLVYHLLSLAANRRLRLLAPLEGDHPEADSVTPIWPGADWLEREVWDMFGIRFRGHPDLKRILMPEGYDGHPLRKEFPQLGIDPGRHYREWDAGREG